MDQVQTTLNYIWAQKERQAKQLRRANEPVREKLDWQGLPVWLEFMPGDVRSGEGKSGPWEKVMQHGYGFIPRTVSADGEDIDVYLGNHSAAREVYEITQVREDGSFDEKKFCLNFKGPLEALESYLYHGPPFGFGAMLVWEAEEWLDWAKDQQKEPTRKLVIRQKED